MAKIKLEHCYSDNIYNKKIAILGPCPPPLGGVSIHIKRVIKKLKDQGNVVHHFDSTQECKRHFISYFYGLIKFLLRVRPDSLYYHTLFLRNYWLEFAILAILKKLLRYRFIIIEHSSRYLSQRSVSFKKALNFFMRAVDHQVLIGNAMHQAYCEHHMHFVDNISVESAFILPNFLDEQAIIKQYPKPLNDFLAKHSPIIVANGSQLIFFEGRELYGLDMCIELISSLITDYLQIGLMFGLPSIGDKRYFIQQQNIIKRLKLENNIYFLLENHELWPLLKKADLFVRPTSVDTYPVSLEEALSLGIPAIASDVCMRPAGTVLFEQRNQQDFGDKVRKVLADLEISSANDCCTRVSFQSKLHRQ